MTANQKPHPAVLSRNYSNHSCYYTPSFLIRGMLRWVDYFLQEHFKLSGGLFAGNIEYLDPSAGELDFAKELIKLAEERLPHGKFVEWFKNCFISQNYAFDIDKSALIRGLSNLIADLPEKSLHAGLKIPNEIPNEIVDEKANGIHINNKSEQIHSEFHIYQRNPLKKPALSAVNGIIPPCNNEHILVIYGNPPYSVSSQTKSPWIVSLVEDYKKDLHHPHTKKIKGLKGIQDDYVKFLRYCQWLSVDRDKNAIVALVLNNYWLDGDIFRGMRSNLLQNFSNIYVIDLFGDPKKEPPNYAQNSSVEMQPGEKDENVFGIQTGICLFFGIYQKKSNNSPLSSKSGEHKPKVYYCGYFGSISRKIEFCNRKFRDLPFTPVDLYDGFRTDFSFIPISEHEKGINGEFRQFYYLPDIFKENIIGIQSLHDTLVTHPDKKRLVEILTSFYDGTYDREIMHDNKGQQWVKFNGVVYHDARDWKIADGKKGTLEKAVKSVQQWQWRGFDRWWVAYNQFLMTKGSSSYKLMQFMHPFQNNLAIVTSRKSRKASGESSVLVTDILAESHCLEGGSGIGDYIFPLKISAVNPRKYDWERPLPADQYNFTEEIWKYLPKKNPPAPTEFFAFIYAVLWTPFYRERYRPLLKKDFPRIPLPKNAELILEFSELGTRLIMLHTFRFDLLKKPVAEEIQQMFPVSKGRIPYVKSIKWMPELSRIYLDYDNPEESFWISGITQEMWDFEIGGHQQLKLYLKHRRITPSNSKKNKHNLHGRRFQFTRALNGAELQRFLEICYIIKQTLGIQSKLDENFQKFLKSEILEEKLTPKEEGEEKEKN